MKKLTERFIAMILGAVLVVPIIALSQDWYEHSGIPVARSPVSSAEFRTEFAAVETAMDKLPVITGNGGKIIRVNAGATALEAASTGIAVSEGGTGAATLTGLLQGNGTSAITGITNSSTVGEVLRVTGAATYAWGALNLADGDAITGDIPDGNLSANVPLLDAANTFTEDITISASSAPRLDLVDTDTSAQTSLVVSDALGWVGTATNTDFFIRTNNTDRITVENDGAEIQLDATTLDFNGAADVSGALTVGGTLSVNGQIMQITSTTPQHRWIESDASADNGAVIALSESEIWSLRLYNDALDSSTSAIRMLRTDNTVDEIELNATTLDFNGALDVDGAAHNITGTTSVTLATTGTADIVIASNDDLTLTAGRTFIGVDMQPTSIGGDDVTFPHITTTASAANAFLDSGDLNRIYRSTSSVKYKRDIESMDEQDFGAVLNLRPVEYRSRIETDGNRQYVGLIAEEVAEVDPRLVHYLDGEPDGVMYDRVTVELLGVVQAQQAQLQAMQAEIEALKLLVQ